MATAYERTRRDNEIVRLVRQGYKAKDIAVKLDISYNTCIARIRILKERGVIIYKRTRSV